MTVRIPPLSREARRSVWIGCTAITLASVAGSEVMTYIISMLFNLHADVPAYLVSGVIPVLLAGPGSYFQLTRLEQVKNAYRELERAAKTDPLTNALNRHAFVRDVSACTQIGRPGALLLIDIDGLKLLNDSGGPQAGDDAIRNVAGVIEKNAGDSDLFGRLGGGEFGLYLRVASAQHASDIAEAIREGVEDLALQSDGTASRLTTSVGIAATEAPIAFPDLLRLAGRQLQAAKANGRNRIAITAVETVGKVGAAA